MAKIPYFPFYPDDYLSSPGVTTCEIVEEGIYLRLLAYSWKHDGCQLPDDITYLRRLCKGVRTDRLLSVLNRHFERIELESGKFYWRNSRLFTEFCKSIAKSDKAKESINYRWNKEKQDTDELRTKNERNTNQNQNQNQNQNKDIGRRKFTPPTPEQVKDYCFERQNRVDPQKFVDHYTSNGWRVGKNPMKDWKAAVRTWERNDTGGPHGQNAVGSGRAGGDRAKQLAREMLGLGRAGTRPLAKFRSGSEPPENGRGVGGMEKGLGPEVIEGSAVEIKETG